MVILKKSKKTVRKRLWLWAALTLVLVIAALAITLSYHLSSAKKPHAITPSSSPTNKGTANVPDTTPQSAGTANNQTVSTPKQQPAVVPQAAPAAPTGDLLNQHQVSANGSVKLESTCQTSAGYSCAVQATNTSTGKVILVKTATADSNGAAIIDWSGSDVGVGTWTIRLVASIGTQSTTSTIHDQLEVTQ